MPYLLLWYYKILNDNSLICAPQTRKSPKKSVLFNQAQAQSRKRAVQVAPIPSIYIAHYVVDFGSVIRGPNKVKRFRVQNISTQQV